MARIFSDSRDNAKRAKTTDGGTTQSRRHWLCWHWFALEIAPIALKRERQRECSKEGNAEWSDLKNCKGSQQLGAHLRLAARDSTVAAAVAWMLFDSAQARLDTVCDVRARSPLDSAATCEVHSVVWSPYWLPVQTILTQVCLEDKA